MITPLIFLWGTLTFISALIVHIIVWRIIQPNRQMMWLVIIFIIIPDCIYTVSFAGLYLTGGSSPAIFDSLFNFICLIIWHTSLSSAYIMTYPPIQAGCPSLKIMLAVSGSMPDGLTIEEIDGIFSEETLFSDRFDDLIEDGLISWEYDTWGITGTGRLLARFFLAYRRILKLPVGEG